MERRIKSIGVLSILILLILGEPLHSSAQISGNQVFQNGGGRMQYQGYHSNNEHRHDQSSHMDEVKLSDSTFRVRAKVMKYEPPEHAEFDKVVGEPPLEPRPVFILELDVAYELVQG